LTDGVVEKVNYEFTKFLKNEDMEEGNEHSIDVASKSSVFKYIKKSIEGSKL
jgi:hypothetical protein